MTGVGGYEQQQQVAAWKAYLAWECSNPQKLAGADLTSRVNLAFDQALMSLRHYPDVRSGHCLKACVACLDQVKNVSCTYCVFPFNAAMLSDDNSHCISSVAQAWQMA